MPSPTNKRQTVRKIAQPSSLGTLSQQQSFRLNMMKAPTMFMTDNTDVQSTKAGNPTKANPTVPIPKFTTQRQLLQGSNNQKLTSQGSFTFTRQAARQKNVQFDMSKNNGSLMGESDNEQYFNA